MVSRRVALLYVAYCVGVMLVFAAAAEVVLRLRGATPWRPDPVDIHVEPGGRFYRAHEKLGYAHLPGRFTVRLATGYEFAVTHGADTLRSTRPEAARIDPAAAPIWVFGGSFTYGWSVNDAETYAWQLQARRPDLDLVNFGVNGYGTLHSLLQLQRALADRSAPRVAVLAYGAFHDPRNTFLRARRKRVAPFSRLGPLVQPYARLEGDELRLAMAEVEYREFPGMRVSAFVHFLEQRYNGFEERRIDSAAVTRALVREFARVAREAGAEPLIATITVRGEAMRDFAAREGIAVADISVNPDLPGWRNLPHDEHPSALGHRVYAAKLERALAELGLYARGGASLSR